MNFLTVYLDVSGRADAEPDLISMDGGNRDADVAGDDDLLADATGENQHRRPLRGKGRPVGGRECYLGPQGPRERNYSNKSPKIKGALPRIHGGK